MHEMLRRRCTLVLLAAVVLALATGLLAWGPVPWNASSLPPAPTRRALDLAALQNVLCSLVQVVAGGWGWRLTRASPLPVALQRPWAGFHLLNLLAGAAALVFHLSPGWPSWLLAHATVSSAFALLAAGALAERVDARLGETPVLSGLLLLAAAGGLVTAWSGGADLRGLLLLDVLPALLLPASCFGLRGEWTRAPDWVVMLSGYSLARLAGAHDDWVRTALGGLGGQALMHLLLAGVGGWLAYCAWCAGRASAAAAPDSAASRSHTALNTAG